MKRNDGYLKVSGCGVRLLKVRIRYKRRPWRETEKETERVKESEKLQKEIKEWGP